MRVLSNSVGARVDQGLLDLLANGLHVVFVVVFVIGASVLMLSLLLPRGRRLE